jgi:predicted transcriptional regulator
MGKNNCHQEGGIMSQESGIQAFKFRKKGLMHIFGELEAKLMTAIWALDEPSGQEVIDYLGSGLNYKTTLTVLNRLVEKGVLNRRKLGRAFVYKAIAPRDEFLSRVFDQMVRGMFDSDFRHIALAQMVETVEDLDPQMLDNIANLIQQRKENEPKV